MRGARAAGALSSKLARFSHSCRKGRAAVEVGTWLSLAAVAIGLSLVVPTIALMARSASVPFDSGELDHHLHLMARTVEMAGAAVVVSLVLGIPGGLLLGLSSCPGLAGMALAGIGLVAVPAHLHAIAWSALVGPQGWFPGGASLLYSVAGAGAVLGAWLAPMAMLIVARGCRHAGRSPVEAAMLIRGPGAAVRHVVLPAAAPWIGVSAVLVFALAAGSYGIAEHLRVRVHTVEVMAQFGALADGAGAAALAMPLAVLSGSLGVFALAWLLKHGRDGHAGQPIGGFGGGWVGSAAFAGLLGLSGGLPLALLGWRAGGVSLFPEAVRVLGPDLAASLSVSVPAGLVASVAGLVLALAWRWSRWPLLSRALALVCLLAFALPESIVAIAAVSWLSSSVAAPVFYGTATGLALVLGLRYAPLAWAVQAAAASSIGAGEEEAALLAQSNTTRFLLRIAWPRMAPAFAAAGLLVVALSLADLDAALVMTPPGMNPAGVRLFNMIHYGLDSLLAASILLVSLSVAAVAAAGGWLASRSGE